jgi:hypothetical protein
VNPQGADEDNGDADLDLADEHLIRYWTARFRCTPAELLSVVARTGRSIAAVRSENARRSNLREALKASP